MSLLRVLIVPLALSASAFILCRSKLRANPFCIFGVNSFCQSWQKTLQNWQQRIIYLSFAAKTSCFSTYLAWFALESFFISIYL
jgi:hypothetical protein